MHIEIIPVTLFQSNCVIIWDGESKHGVLFDPGGDAGEIIRFLEAKAIAIDGIFLTHGHVDHVAGTNKLREFTGAMTYLHPEDRPLAEHTARQCLMFGIGVEEAPVIDHDLADGQHFDFGPLSFDVTHAPGHSPGCCIFGFGGDKPLLVAGDLLFAGSIGRVDLPGGDPEKMRQSLEKVSRLDEKTVVIPGHGPNTTIGTEKRRNPYLARGAAIW
jgi:glyoxylase-like metal-dependent hydrolase (beta-lactamase superfamily II)